MPFDQLHLPAIQGKHSVKWSLYGEEVLPLWVADMDFPVAPAILEGIRQRLEKNIGYPLGAGDPELLEAILAQQVGSGLEGLQPENLWLTTSVVPAIYASVLGLTSAGDEVLTQVPIYPPFLNSISDLGRVTVANPMVRGAAGYELDLDHLEHLITPASRLLMLCNPHNPTGRVFTRAELEALAELALRHRLWIMSDELHAGLILEGQHIPIASLSPEVAQRTVTLTGPCKTYNTAGLGGGVAISHNKAVLSRLKKATVGVMGHPNVAAMAMWTAALHQAEPWRQQVLGYLRANRDYLGQFLAQRLPQVAYHAPQGTYLAWLDFSAYHLPSRPQDLFLKAGVALNEGSTFGKEYPQCVRLNFATSRPILSEALERMAAALPG